MNVDFQYNKFIIHNIHHVIEYLLKLNYLIFFFFYFLFRNIYLYILPPFYFHIIFRVIEITIVIIPDTFIGIERNLIIRSTSRRA